MFAPSEIGPLKVIVEQGDATYHELRAKELIAEAQLATTQLARINSPNGDFFTEADALRLTQELTETYQIKMKQAISLLAIARAERGAAQEVAKK